MAVMVMLWRRRRRWRSILKKWRGLCHDADTQQQCCDEENYLFHVRLDAIYSPKMLINFALPKASVESGYITYRINGLHEPIWL
jgi:hypothetical protein